MFQGDLLNSLRIKGKIIVGDAVEFQIQDLPCHLTKGLQFQGEAPPQELLRIFELLDPDTPPDKLFHDLQDLLDDWHCRGRRGKGGDNERPCDMPCLEGTGNTIGIPLLGPDALHEPGRKPPAPEDVIHHFEGDVSFVLSLDPQ
ncbi:MAG: hypothetical protein A2Y65_03335 [Deltaproteobacteria bacterium RBG_13_52_11]|nr:MAG: hypothetical protein A2Y65_03335 [Deltaproteobacteria bacterium RBG_13_52_11]